MSKLIRVLIADDSSIMRRTIGQAISMDAGMEIVGSAQDCAEAVACFRAQRPDVVLLDVEMPRVNGYAALKSIREIDKFVPVIMFGSFPAANESLKREALAAGATERPAKPTGVGHIDTAIAFLRSEVVSKIFMLGLRFKSRLRVPATTQASRSCNKRGPHLSRKLGKEPSLHRHRSLLDSTSRLSPGITDGKMQSMFSPSEPQRWAVQRTC